MEQLQAQFKQYESFLNCSQTEVDELSDMLAQYDNLRDCNSVFEAFRQAILPSIGVFRQLFILDPSISVAVYSSLVRILEIRKTFDSCLKVLGIINQATKPVSIRILREQILSQQSGRLVCSSELQYSGR